MFENSTPFALFAAVFALNLVVAWLVARRAGSVPSESPERLDDGRLRCPECATVNDPEYRFCRNCVTELRKRAPTAPIRPSGGRSPFP